ncbi:Phytoene desaturase (lycopene-forming) [Defluviimonas aquaemixtae]|uniref:Phytoene desaturase (Lycopene-forming) n=1 Tax=Albidovulum aquaemixtae TaxID=1542388 RepID=A0A2R8BNS6_9RHOB|nr:NAD(P)/FAD-dependent oxidoreductase [Defluviimonas aquaemixtae]SPH25024.1 Phytoene desaturase (lycopene-forming) [Defluviimonas aquaemixtae]
MTDADKTNWDAIVIGSGMGGMAAAAALSKGGHKVLLLEQYQTLGGLTHSFSREGFTWDAGIHYLSGIAPGDRMRDLLDWLSDTPIEFTSMGAVYDNLHIGDADPLALSRPFEAQERDFKDRFPDEAKAIEAWTAALREGRESMHTIFSTRAMPELLGTVLQWWNGRAIDRWCKRTTQEVIDEITDNPELAAAFAAQWFDHGGRPSKASFAMHALISASYLESGAWYPVGGGAVFAEHILPTIAAGGGEARAGARVETLLFEDDRIVGVRTTDGEEFRADAVISDIGARETVNHLLPDDCGHQDWIDEIRSLPPSIAHFSLFMGFEGDVEDAGATRSNHWIYPTGKVDVVWTDAPDSPPPGMFVSFASVKDPGHDPGPAQRYAGELVAWADWSTVEKWADTDAGERGDDYRSFKTRVEDVMFAQFEAYFPELASLVVFRDLSTPLTTSSITGHHRGAFYGLDVTPKRVMSGALQAKTPVPGLFLAGQDVASPGIPGALWGGLLAAASVDPKIVRQFRG